MSNEAFESAFEGEEVSEEEMEILLEANSETRKTSAVYSLYASAALLLLLGAYAVKHIPDKLD